MKEIRFYFSQMDFAKFVIDDNADTEGLEEEINRCSYFIVPRDELNPNQLHINLDRVWFVAWVDIQDSSIKDPA